VPSLSKTELRLRARKIRRQCAADAPEAALRAAERLPLERLPAFASFAGYCGSELDPSALIGRLAATGALFALPMAETRDAPLSFRAWDPAEGLVEDAYDIPAPPSTASILHPDLVIAPLLAFDRRGGRLGQGAGHYDRAIASLRAIKPVFILGLAYAGQELDEAPIEPHDQRLDAILTETGYIEVGQGH
jgi:5-formyltetrahydrofolate cyclo-ligase